jgi:uncharacterized protein YlxW (UPF0749 family)
MRRRFDVMPSMPEGDRRRPDRDRRSPEGDRRERPSRARGPLPRRSQLLVGLLCATLGFALAVQVHTTRSTPSLAAARPEDLVSILDDLTARGDRLRAEADSLTATRDRLTAGGQESTAALDEARQRADTLGILAGTVPATGAGIVLTITDPQASVRSDVLLDTMEELRDAGAEAMSVSGVRVVTSTYFLDRDGGVEVDGRLLRPPYVFLVIGDPRTLAAALDIPGGVLDTVRRRPGASAAVEQQPQVDVTALRALVTPRYARPAAAESGSIG